MNCKKCGKNLDTNEDICKDCEVKKEEKRLKKEADELTWLSAFLCLFFPLLMIILEEEWLFKYDFNSSILINASFLIGLTILAFIRIKYPKHKASKIVLIIAIIGLLLYVCLMILGIIACFLAIPMCLIELGNCPG